MTAGRGRDSGVTRRLAHGSTSASLDFPAEVPTRLGIKLFNTAGQGKVWN